MLNDGSRCFCGLLGRATPHRESTALPHATRERCGAQRLPNFEATFGQCFGAELDKLTQTNARSVPRNTPPACQREKAMAVVPLHFADAAVLAASDCTSPWFEMNWSRPATEVQDHESNHGDSFQHKRPQSSVSLLVLRLQWANHPRTKCPFTREKRRASLVGF